MANDEIFRALSSSTRIKILKIISKREIHLSALAREIGISKPVASKHIKKLEQAGLIKKRVVGNLHFLKLNVENLEKRFEPFIQESDLTVEKNESLFHALKQIPGINIKKEGKHQYIESIDGEKGYYIYEVNNKTPDKPIDEYKIKKNEDIELKKIITVSKNKIKIRVKSEE